MRTSRAARQAATDRVPRDGHPETLFDGDLHFGHRQDTLRGAQGADRGPLDHAIAEPLRPKHRCGWPQRAHTGSLGDPLQDAPQGSIMV